MRRKRIISLSVLCILIALVLSYLYFFGFKEYQWEKELFTPTQIVKVGSDYFIEDCWHGRIIYNDNLEDSIYKWKTLTDNVKGGHTIASDGNYLLCDDSENNQVKVFQINNGEYNEISPISVENRPHYVTYDKKNNCFFCISSYYGQITKIVNVKNNLVIDEIYYLPECVPYYTRSMNVIDGYFYIPTAAGIIYQYEYENDFSLIKEWNVSNSGIGLNYIYKIDDYWYLSVYTNENGECDPKFIRAKDLSDFKNGECEDIREALGITGIPYFISNFDEKYWITEIHTNSGIIEFDINNNEIVNAKKYFYTEEYTKETNERKEEVFSSEK